MSHPEYNFEGKVALITGASGGIGSAVAELLGSAGARVFLAGTREDKLEQLAGQLRKRSIECAHMALDITAPGAPARLVEAAAKQWSRLDILVNAAGINRPQKAEEFSEENWDAVFNINLRALFLVSQAAGRKMIDQGYGRIVNISSQNRHGGHSSKGRLLFQQGGGGRPDPLTGVGMGALQCNGQRGGPHLCGDTFCDRDVR